MNQNKSQKNHEKNLEPESESKPKGFNVRPVGFKRTPSNPITLQPMFCIILGLYDDDGAQVTHTLATGEERPVVFMSLPLPVDANSEYLLEPIEPKDTILH